jgi:hypothetical protein
MIFHVRPNGEVRIPDDHLADAAEVSAALKAADSRIRPFVPRTQAAGACEPERHAGSSARDRQEWLLLQHRGGSLVA